MKMKIFHGSKKIIEKPQFGVGKIHNDYGRGFYCTESLEIAKEWACDYLEDGFANAYELDCEELKILNLNDKKYNILHWLSILIQNRTFSSNSEMEIMSKKFLMEKYNIDISEYDLIIGYRADDSYHRFAEDFLNNSISVEKLERAKDINKASVGTAKNIAETLGCNIEEII